MVPSALAAALLLALPASSTRADERVIRERLPVMLQGLPRIDEVRPTQLPGLTGLWSVRVGGHMLYTDGQATVLFEGQVIDLASGRNLTRQALDQALAVDFDTLPLRDAIATHLNGSGQRRLAVFADPTCGYCQQFERELSRLDNATVYTFVIDMLGPEATDKARRILCDPAPAAAWAAWMLRAEPPKAGADCEAASTLVRNRELAARLGITGTPTTLLTDRTRIGGVVALPALRVALDGTRLKASDGTPPPSGGDSGLLR
jgi:thiol:disulfide interchange protein DsbC